MQASLEARRSAIDDACVLVAIDPVGSRLQWLVALTVAALLAIMQAGRAGPPRTAVRQAPGVGHVTVPAADDRIEEVFSPLTGRVAQVLVRVGEHVHKGDPLATIESPDISSATSDVAKVRAELLAAERDFKRQQQLVRMGEPRRELEMAEDTYRAAKAELERVTARRDLFGSDPYTLRATLDGEVLAVGAYPTLEVFSAYGGAIVPALFTIRSIGAPR
jgi:multidrug efflux pump subunit AcrA (membrane-fusion protein)